MVVIDFGLARDFKKSSTGVMGTPGYMPPEAGGNSSTSSLGCTVFFGCEDVPPQVWTQGIWTIYGDIFSMGALALSHWPLDALASFGLNGCPTVS